MPRLVAIFVLNLCEITGESKVNTFCFVETSDPTVAVIGTDAPAPLAAAQSTVVAEVHVVVAQTTPSDTLAVGVKEL
jgi:hypothetical protein